MLARVGEQKVGADDGTYTTGGGAYEEGDVAGEGGDAGGERAERRQDETEVPPGGLLRAPDEDVRDPGTGLTIPGGGILGGSILNIHLQDATPPEQGGQQ